MAYSRTYTIDAGPTGDTVKAAVATKLDGDLTNAYTYLNAHDVATTNVHGLGTAYVVGTTTAQTLTNKTISSPTLTGTVDTTGATFSPLGEWEDYSSTSTVTGWAGGYTADIRYSVVGKIVYVRFYISGTSDGSLANFTLPFTPANSAYLYAMAYCVDPGGVGTSWGSLTYNSGISKFVIAVEDGAWAPAGAGKIAAGQFFFEIA